MMKENKSTTSGTTMVEVMVAFVILVLFMGIFSQAMGLAGRMMNRSTDTMVKYHQLAGDYFLEKADSVSEDATVLKFKRVTKDGADTGDGFEVQAKVRTHTKSVAGGSSEIRLYEVENAVKP
ncbi:hypothetical protein [Clostridium sp. AN503]|uniref:PulJ/GspJ family protein n=1 Tax=Clostridium sp. AN503 TaxID=3160598 RepID=UPI00345B0723